MTAQELATAVRYRLRVIALVHNDSTYGAIKNIQKRAHEGRYLDVELNNPDFLQLAAAYGVPGSRVRGPEELHAAVAAALDRDGPSRDRGPGRMAVSARSGDARTVRGCGLTPKEGFIFRFVSPSCRSNRPTSGGAWEPAI